MYNTSPGENSAGTALCNCPVHSSRCCSGHVFLSCFQPKTCCMAETLLKNALCRIFRVNILELLLFSAFDFFVRCLGWGY